MVSDIALGAVAGAAATALLQRLLGNHVFRTTSYQVWHFLAMLILTNPHKAYERHLAF